MRASAGRLIELSETNVHRKRDASDEERSTEEPPNTRFTVTLDGGLNYPLLGSDVRPREEPPLVLRSREERPPRGSSDERHREELPSRLTTRVCSREELPSRLTTRVCSVGESPTRVCSVGESPTRLYREIEELPERRPSPIGLPERRNPVLSALISQHSREINELYNRFRRELSRATRGDGGRVFPRDLDSLLVRHSHDIQSLSTKHQDEINQLVSDIANIVRNLNGYDNVEDDVREQMGLSN